MRTPVWDAMHDFHHYQGFLIDLDGTLIRGAEIVEGAAELLQATAGQFVVVSNNSSDTPVELSQKLCRGGLPVPADRILLAGTLAVEQIAAQQPRARVQILGSAALHRHALDRGLMPVEADADIVLVARDEALGYARLAAAANAVRAGARLFIANPDLTHPGPAGSIVPETGAIAAALLACTGQVPRTLVGKPEPALFTAGLAILGTPANRTLVIGDNPATDAAGAEKMHLPFILVGVHQDMMLAQLARRLADSRRLADPLLSCAD